MKRTRFVSQILSSPRLPQACLLAAGALAAPWAQAQSNAPVTGTMMQSTTTPAARPPVVRQMPAGASPTAATPSAQAAQAPRAVQSAQPVTTVVTPAAAPAASPAPMPAVAAAPAAPPSVFHGDPFVKGPRLYDGEATRAALDMQSSGRYAGPGLPMLGVTATPAWRRYVNSFSHEVPEFYETTSQPQGAGQGR